MPGVLELSEDARTRMRELRDLSERAEGGDEEARKELRRLVRSSSPEVIGRASDIGRTAGRMAARTAAGGGPLVEEALFARLDALRREIAGENPTPLEVLLTERVVACWMLVELFEVLTAAQLSREGEHRVPISHTLQMVKWQESANRRYLAAIRELARVGKLQANAPRVQYNTQINLDGRG